jgi:mRNA interferase YafQ
MRRLVRDARFRRAFKRKTRRIPRWQDVSLNVVAVLAKDPFDPELKIRKLHGQFEALWACWVDCRIVFAFEPDPTGGDDVIVLVDIASHDEVY